MGIKFSNNATAALASGITSTATSLSLNSGQGALFPATGAGDYFFVTLVDSSNNLEIVKVTARTSDTLTIVRGQDGTSGRSFSAGDKCELRNTAAVMEALQTEISDAITDFSSRTLTAGTGLSGGGDLSADRTFNLTDTGVTAGSYGSGTEIPTVTVDAQGRVTAASGNAVVFPGSTSDVEYNSFGVGTPASATTGEIRATNNVTAYYSSDSRLKENVRAIEGACDIVDQIRGVRYDWTEDYIAGKGGEDGVFVRKSDIGVIAQEIEAVFPEIVADNSDGYKAVRYERLVAVLIEAVKELNAQVKALKA